MVQDNPVCEKGCYDRHGEPGCLVKACTPQSTYIHYEGCNGCAILGFLFGGPFCCYVTFCWTPTLQRKEHAMMVGGPVMAAPVMATPAYGQVQGAPMQMM